jgi:hypothetical protein
MRTNLLLILAVASLFVLGACDGGHISGGVAIKGIEDAASADLDLDGFDDAVLSSIEGDTQTLGIHWLAGENLEEPSNWRGFNLASAQHAGYMKARAGQIDGVSGADIVAGTRTLDGNMASIFWFKAPAGTCAWRIRISSTGSLP